MANVQRGRSGSGKYPMAIASATVVEIGDFIYRDPSTGKAVNAGGQTDQTSEPKNQRLVATNFAGVSEHQSLSGQTADILVDASPLREFAFGCASETHEVGDLLGIDETSGGDALEDQVLVKVSDPASAIVICTRRDAAATTTVYGRLFRSVFWQGPQAGAPAGQIEARTLTGATTITIRDPRTLLLDPGGADRAVTLPAVATMEGQRIRVVNTADADETITVNTTLKDIRRGEWAEFLSDGATYYVIAEGYVPGAGGATAGVIPFGPAAARTLTGALVLDDTDPSFLLLDPGGAGRTVDLPAASNRNRPFLIVNTADMAEDLTVRLTGGGATVVTISQSESGIVVPHSTTWSNASLAEAT